MKHFVVFVVASAIGLQLSQAQEAKPKAEQIAVASNALAVGDSAAPMPSTAPDGAKREGTQQGQAMQSPISLPDRSVLRISFQERFRIESTDNATTLSSAANGGSSYSRYRSLLQFQYLPMEELQATVRFGNEFRYYFAPTNKGFSSNEIFIDQLFAKWNMKSLFPATLTFGRQEMAFGEGFLVSDGTPLDGTRTMYFDAARVDVTVAPQNVVSAFAMFVPRMDRVLPIVHDQMQVLADGGEGGAGAYYAGDFGSTSLQAYALHKENYTSLDRPVRSHMNALGGRVRLDLFPGLRFTGEGAYEFGVYGNEKSTGVGGYSYVDYRTGAKGFVPSMVTFTAVYLSGDKPGTTTREGWDPLWGRSPKWNNLYYYSFTKEAGVGFWTNYFSVGPSVTFGFSKDVSGVFGFYHLSAPVAPVTAKFPGGTGKDRGNLFTSRINYTLNETFSGHFIWERLQPGSFYFKDASVSTWMRIELQASI